jgi:CDGSH-type Zn-finger protein
MAEDSVPALQITVRDRGPYRVYGTIRLVDAEGAELEVHPGEKGYISLCRCGHSNTKPFCDGTHKTVEFDSIVRIADLTANPD